MAIHVNATHPKSSGFFSGKALITNHLTQPTPAIYVVESEAFFPLKKAIKDNGGNHVPAIT